MRIAIVEDSQEDMERLRSGLETVAAEETGGCVIDGFLSGEAFLRAFRPGIYDLIFFDNYIGTSLGIDIARKVRALDADAEMAFVSMSAEFAVLGFEVRALHYLIKPVTTEEIRKVFERWRERRPTVAAKTVELMIGHEMMAIPLDELRAVEVADKACILHGLKNEPRTYLSMDKLMALLPKKQFLRTHRSFAINMACVQAMAKTAFLMKGGAEIPIGRAYRDDCKCAYMEYLASR